MDVTVLKGLNDGVLIGALTDALNSEARALGELDSARREIALIKEEMLKRMGEGK